MGEVIVKDLGATAYQPTFAAMQAFTDQRVAATIDEIWLTEHLPVFTQGQAGRAEHLLAPGDIPVVQSDRGGQVTYHGPGQITAYLMFDLRRLGIGVRDLVTGIENTMVAVIAHYGIHGAPRPDAPGVYVGADKIGSLGLRVRHARSYHGLSLNVDMDLEPFARINPCGLLGVAATHMAAYAAVQLQDVQVCLVATLLREFGMRLHGDSDVRFKALRIPDRGRGRCARPRRDRPLRPPKRGLTAASVLEGLGLQMTWDPSEAEAWVDECGFAVTSAAGMLPSLMSLRRVRAEIGVRTPLSTVEKLLAPEGAGILIGDAARPRARHGDGGPAEPRAPPRHRDPGARGRRRAVPAQALAGRRAHGWRAPGAPVL